MMKVFCLYFVCIIIVIVILLLDTNHYSMNMDHEIVLEKFKVLILLWEKFENSDFHPEHLLGFLHLSKLSKESTQYTVDTCNPGYSLLVSVDNEKDESAYLFCNIVCIWGRCTPFVVSQVPDMVWSWNLYQRLALLILWPLMTFWLGHVTDIIYRTKIDFWWYGQK